MPLAGCGLEVALEVPTDLLRRQGRLLTHACGLAEDSCEDDALLVDLALLLARDAVLRDGRRAKVDPFVRLDGLVAPMLLLKLFYYGRRLGVLGALYKGSEAVLARAELGRRRPRVRVVVAVLMGVPCVREIVRPLGELDIALHDVVEAVVGDVGRVDHRVRGRVRPP